MPTSIKNSVTSELRAAGILPSKPRVAVYSYLLTHPIHPTVDQIYTDLSPVFPNLSRTTVYNTLRLFVKEGLAIQLNIENGELRYDTTTRFHAHFKCSVCGNIFDLHDIPMPQPPSKDFDCQSVQLSFYGICPSCRKQSGNASPKSESDVH